MKVSKDKAHFGNSFKPLIDETLYNQLVADFDAGCGSLLNSCANDTGNGEACNNADQTCMQKDGIDLCILCYHALSSPHGTKTNP